MNFTNFETRLSDVLDKTGQWMATSEGKIEWTKVMSQNWDFSIDPNFDSFSMGKCSGLIAYSRDPMTPIDMRQTIRIYNHSSALLSTISVDHECKKIEVYVFKNDNIGCITNDGFVFIYSHNFAIKKTQFFQQKNSNLSVIASAFWEEGIVVLSSDGTLYESVHFEKPQILTKLENIDSKPSSFIVIPFISSPTKGTIVLITLSNGEIIMASSTGSYRVAFDSPVAYSAVSSSCTSIAFLHEDHSITVTDILMSEIIYKVNVDFSIFGEFQMMKWCGDLAPVVLFENGLIFACSDETNPCWSFDGKCIAFTEIDSLYVITQTESYRLVELSDDVSGVLSSLAVTDGSKLCKIYDERNEEPIYQHIDEIDLQKASDECLKAAIFVSDPECQTFFLNAASLCKKHSALERTIKNVRILNTLRMKASMPITFEQQVNLETEGIIKRLCYRRMHDIAADIAQETHSSLVNIGEDFVEYAVSNILDDRECLDELRAHDFVNFSYAAMVAIRRGRAFLAKSLVENEKDLGRRSYYLGKLGRWEQAFETVTVSCDMSALFTLVVMAMSQSDTDAVNKAIALSEPACFFTLRFPDLIGKDRIKTILELVDRNCSFSNVLNRFLSFQPGFSLPGCEGLLSLLKLQEVIGNDIHQKDLAGKSFNATIRRLAHLGLKQTAKLFAKECNVSDSRFAVIYIQGLVDEGSYDALIKFVSKKKRKCVWELAAELLYNKGQESQARLLCQSLDAIDKKRAQRIVDSLDNKSIGPKTLSNRTSVFKLFGGDSFLF